jgi:hypothetical protein
MYGDLAEKPLPFDRICCRLLEHHRFLQHSHSIVDSVPSRGERPTAS